MEFIFKLEMGGDSLNGNLMVCRLRVKTSVGVSMGLGFTGNRLQYLFWALDVIIGPIFFTEDYMSSF